MLCLPHCGILSDVGYPPPPSTNGYRRASNINIGQYAYHRLKQGDYDGALETSHIVQGRNIFNNTLLVYPNPVLENNAQIVGARMINMHSEVAVSDIAGNQLTIVQTVTGSLIFIRFPAAIWPGAYVCNVFTQGLENKSVRIVLKH